MRHPAMALALLLSFSELAWIASFFISLVYLSEAEILQDKLQATQTQLEEAEREVARLGSELKQERDDLRIARGTLDQLTTELNLAKEEVDSLTNELERAKAEVDSLTNELERAKAEVDRLAGTLKQATAEVNRLTKDLKQEKRELEEAKLRAARCEKDAEPEPRIHTELVGLKGDMKRVVIVVDRSASMLSRSRDMPGENRWTQARRVVRTWMQHLEMEECALITFSTEANVFRADGKVFFRLGNDEEGQRNRNLLLEHLQHMPPPKGRTNTFDALQEAYRLESVDTILLFTDGEPTGRDSGAFDQKVAEEIYAMCVEESNRTQEVPINIIGLGNYFDGDLSRFLLKVAEITGGTFHGR